ncbi:hypothetical protein FB567DRAFT_533126 [Paraphoma chrysanthemicola]|uniref:Uncharacterized protein n=1 Tax=Paraphoma chrysanthemicola TaxID=798071 RepID=A0A8K0QZC7_9PLEO|nr:hypothetical protein FB567DRAFT_533126 [Paraphoma chrysanthemicola]
MLAARILAVTFFLNEAYGLALTSRTTPVPQVPSLVGRADDPAIPTFTFGSNEQYFPSQAAEPRPAGTLVQIFPTGVHDEFPDDGITIALGAELRTKISDIVAQQCNTGSFTQDCHNALMPVIQDSNIAAHTKRFVVIGGLAIISGIIGIVALLIEMGRIANYEVPQDIKLNHNDLVQIQSIGGASTYAAIAAETTAIPHTVSWKPSTTTAANTITIETLAVDKDDHKAGDILFRIPPDVATRIGDFLAMTGIHDTQNKCKDQSIKRADTTEECLRALQRHAMDLADAGPSNLLQVAQQNIPVRPAVGQPIGFPAQDLAMNGVQILVPVYRVAYVYAPRRPNFDMEWSPGVFAIGATAVVIAAHAASAVGESLKEIWVSKSQLVKDFTEDKLSCPKDVLCIADDCMGQDDGEILETAYPYCLKSTNYGCACHPVAYAHELEVEADYIDKQYEWLEELIRKSELPPLTPNCINGEEPLADASEKFKTWSENFCKGHESLESSFTVASEDIQLSPGWKSEVDFRKKGTEKCPFDCQEMFSAFDTPPCITSTGIQRYGTVETDCGKASYGM